MRSISNSEIQGFNPAHRNPAYFETPTQPTWQKYVLALELITIEILPNILVGDGSHWNGDMDPAMMIDDGVEAIILKCSEAAEGTYYEYKDVRFEENWRKFLDAGIPIMLYHFNRGEKGSAEFSWFMKCAHDFLNHPDINGHTAVWHDDEWKPTNMTKSAYANRTFGFCELARGSGFRQGIYSSPGLVPRLFPENESRWNQVFGWNAHWTPAPKDTLPAGWIEQLRKGWQFGIYPTHYWAPEVNGAGTIDLNRFFFATADELRAWMGQDVPPPPTDCCDELEKRIDEAFDLILALNQKIDGNTGRIDEHDSKIVSIENEQTSLITRMDLFDNEMRIARGNIAELERKQADIVTYIDYYNGLLELINGYLG